jgi:hypothetical protein
MCFELIMKQNVGYNLPRPLSTRRSAPHLVKPLHTIHYGLIGTNHGHRGCSVMNELKDLSNEGEHDIGISVT